MTYAYARTTESSRWCPPANTPTRVEVRGTSSFVPRGKPQNFTDEQNEALRAVIREYAQREDLVQTVVGARLGVGQQTVSKFLAGKTGISYPTATKIAMVARGIGVDQLFAQMGVASGESEATDPLPERARATLAARLLGMPEAQLEPVLAWGDPALKDKPAGWWFEMFRAEGETIRATQLTTSQQRLLLSDADRRKRIVELARQDSPPTPRATPREAPRAKPKSKRSGMLARRKAG